jgi:SAM-dependent methyltransferase
MTATDLDPSRIEEFAGRMVGVLNDSFLALSISVGHQTGLFDTMAGLAPSTSAEIAKAADLDERYVREVLGALTTGGITTYDPDLATYALPGEHAALLTRAAGVANMAPLTQFVAVMGTVEQDIVTCFREGGGVPYAKFPIFHQVMAELSKDTIDAILIDQVLDLADGLRPRLEAGIEVADFGCGAGHAMNVLARAFPNSRFTGFDIVSEVIDRARAQAAEWGVTNVTFEVRDVATLDVADRFDLVTAFDAIHDQVDPAGVLDGISRSLKPDGVFLCVDVGASSHLEDNVAHPLGPMIYGLSTFHCMTVSLSEGGAGLGTAWGEQTARAMFADAGFTSIESHQLEADPVNIYYVAQKG